MPRREPPTETERVLEGVLDKALRGYIVEHSLYPEYALWESMGVVKGAVMLCACGQDELELPAHDGSLTTAGCMVTALDLWGFVEQRGNACLN